MKDAADFVCVCFNMFIEVTVLNIFVVGSVSPFFSEVKPNYVYFRNTGLLKFYRQPCLRHVLSQLYIFFTLFFIRLDGT